MTRYTRDDAVVLQPAVGKVSTQYIEKIGRNEFLAVVAGANNRVLAGLNLDMVSSKLRKGNFGFKEQIEAADTPIMDMTAPKIGNIYRMPFKPGAKGQKLKGQTPEYN